MNSEQTKAVFPNTPWTLIQAINEGDDSQFAGAMEKLSELYWPPVYAFLRKQGLSREKSAETAQDFFAEIILQRDLFLKADSKRGRLRSFVRTSLKHFLNDLEDRAATQKRDPLPAGRISYEDCIVEAMHSQDAEEAFDRRWALAILQKALEETDLYFQNGKKIYWAAFEERVLRPSISMTPPLSFAEIAEKLGFEDESKAGHAVRNVKDHVDFCMRKSVVQTSTSDDHEAEFEYLLSLLES